MRRLLLRTALIGTAVLVMACQEDRDVPTYPVQAEPSGLISDGRFLGGNPDFFFRPPLLPNPSGHPSYTESGFNPYVSPRVVICELDSEDGECRDQQPSDFPLEFTMESGPGSVVRLALQDEQYIVNWHTDVVPLDVAAYYRIQVFVGSARLGYADIDPIESRKELKNLQTSESIPLLDGRTLPIKFRIEYGAVCHALFDTDPDVDCSDATAATVDNNGADVVVPSRQAAGRFNPGWLPDGAPEDVTVIISKVIGINEQPNMTCFPAPFSDVEKPGCYQYNTDPELPRDPDKTFPYEVFDRGDVITTQCLDPSVGTAEWEEYQLFQYDPDLVGSADAPSGIVPLEPNAGADELVECPSPIAYRLSDNPVLRLAQRGWNGISAPLAKVFGPRLLWARHAGGLGGMPGSFSPSNIGWALAYELNIESGDNQSLPANTQLPEPLVVKLVEIHTDEHFDNPTPSEPVVPVIGENVLFSASAGVLTEDGNPNNSGQSITVPTQGPDGTASILWTLGSQEGEQTVNASAAAYNAPVTFTATAEAGLPDLVVQSLTHSPANPTVADEIVFTAVVANVGAATAAPSTLEFRIGGETPGDPATQFDVPALGPGEDFTVQRTRSLIAQGYINTAVADVDDDVEESDETNNQTQDSYSVQDIDIFQGTFSADDPDNPPGDPEIGTWDINTSTGNTILVRTAVGNLTNQPVELNRTQSFELSLLGYVEGTPPTTGVYVARWRSLIQSAASNIFAGIVIRDSNTLILADLDYRAGGQLTYNSNSINATVQGFTWTQGQSQIFEVRIDLDAGTTSLSINGTPVSNLQNVQFPEAGASNIARIGFEVGLTTQQTFGWDDITITRVE